MLLSSSKLFLFSKEAHLNSGVTLLLELYCVVVIEHVAFFTIWPKLTVAFTCTSLPLNLYTSVFGCGCGFGFEQKFWQIDIFGEKRHGSADLHTPIHPPPSTCPPCPSIVSNDECTNQIVTQKQVRFIFVDRFHS